MSIRPQPVSAEIGCAANPPQTIVGPRPEWLMAHRTELKRLAGRVWSCEYRHPDSPMIREPPSVRRRVGPDPSVMRWLSSRRASCPIWVIGC